MDLFRVKALVLGIDSLLRLRPAANRGLPNLYPDAAAKGWKASKEVQESMAWKQERACSALQNFKEQT